MLPNVRAVMAATAFVLILIVIAVTGAVRVVNNSASARESFRTGTLFDERAGWNQFADPDSSRRFQFLIARTEQDSGASLNETTAPATEATQIDNSPGVDTAAIVLEPQDATPTLDTVPPESPESAVEVAATTPPVEPTLVAAPPAPAVTVLPRPRPDVTALIAAHDVKAAAAKKKRVATVRRHRPRAAPATESQTPPKQPDVSSIFARPS